MLMTGWDIDEHNRMIERHLQEMRDVAASDRQARGMKAQRTPRRLRRAMGGALIAVGQALAA